MHTLMHTLEAIEKRTSYRGKYKDTPVSRADLTTILKAGLAAPSGCNTQTTSLIAVDDPAVIKKLHQVIKPLVAETAPALICVLTQRIVAYTVGEEKEPRCYSIHDYSAAIENMLLAAVSMGYESCWYEGHVTDADKMGRKIADALGVPADYDLVCILPIGVAAEATKHPAKKPFQDRAWFNGFGQQA